ncbi:MAG: response regulator [Phycisphaera sp.]|nr:MAG: response regulator [Phycisphaera sp.]
MRVMFRSTTKGSNHTVATKVLKDNQRHLLLAFVATAATSAFALHMINQMSEDVERKEQLTQALQAQLALSQETILFGIGVTDMITHEEGEFPTKTGVCPWQQKHPKIDHVSVEGKEFDDLNKAHGLIRDIALEAGLVCNSSELYTKERAAELQEKLLFAGTKYKNLYTERQNAAYNEAASTRQTRDKATPALIALPTVTAGLFMIWIMRRVMRSIDHKSSALVLKQRILAAEANSNTAMMEQMTHEIRTPLTSIIGNAEMMSDIGSKGSEHTELVQTINQNCKHLLHLVDSFFDAQDQNKPISKSEEIRCSITKIIKQSIAITSSPAEAKGLLLTSSIDESIPPYVTSDPLHIRQILVNLLSNAIRHTENGGVHVAARLNQSAEGDSIELSVADTGSGIHERDLPKVFEPGYQSDDPNAGSVGLGLSICKRLCTQLGGSINVKSDLGFGTTFTVSIPAKPFAASVELTQHDGHDNAPLAGMTVLLAEDTLEIQRLFEKHLQAAGANVITVTSGNEYMQIVSDLGNTISLALVDIGLEDLDGITATRRLKELGKDIPTLALTASTSNKHREQCSDAGFEQYLTKPIVANTLIDACSKWSGRSGAA